MLTTLLLALLMPSLPSAPRVQGLVNPSTVEFTPSSDHSVVQNSVNVVASYVVEIVPAAGGAVVASRDIGKPTPVANLITYSQLNTLLSTIPVGSYVAKVCASGPGGVACTPVSTPFSVAVRAPAAPSAAPVVR